MVSKYRIFISYRGNTKGIDFARALYRYLKEDSYSKEKYGEIYFSEEEEISENFIESIPRVMADVECFILPLTKDFFSDFKEQGDDSVTYKEIQIALQNEGIHFVAVNFEGFQFDKELITDLFGSNANKFLGCKQIPYNDNDEMQTMRIVGDQLVQKTFTVRSVKDFEKAPNVHLAFKRDTEDPNDYPYYERLYDVKKITLMNFAATTFMAGYDIATIYQSNEYLRRWFQSRLMNGEIEVEAVLTNPYSRAAIDAEKYKMFPNGSQIQKSEIIIHNLNKFCKFKEKNPHARMRIYLTDIALPYGLMITEHKNRRNNHIKVDMYAPVPDDDRFRPSFYLLEDNRETRELYNFYQSNLMRVMHGYSVEYNCHPDVKWLLRKNIIHKVKISSDTIAHTKMAFAQCMKKKLPIEVDLLSLNDGVIVVGRRDELGELSGVDNVGQLTWRDLKKAIKRNAVVDADQILRLSEFLEYIHGTIPVLLEIKSEELCYESQENSVLVRSIADEVRAYIRKYGLDGNTGKVAIHSSNPYVLRMVRDTDCMIPIGQISLNFDLSEYKAAVDEENKKLHREQLYMQIVQPDFISYDVRDLPNQRIQNLCKQHNIPLLAWTVKDADDQETADENFDNIIIEDSESYL